MCILRGFCIWIKTWHNQSAQLSAQTLGNPKLVVSPRPPTVSLGSETCFNVSTVSKTGGVGTRHKKGGGVNPIRPMGMHVATSKLGGV